MKRKIYDKLLEWKNNKDFIKPLMLLGVRQCGKTYVLNEFCKNEFKNYVYINLFQDKQVVNLYNNDNLSSDEKYNRLKLLINTDLDQEDTILFIDEIQASENIISELKYFCESHNNVRIVCAGSLLGVKLKRNNSSFPVGKVTMLNLYPMDFEEFLIALNENLLLDEIKRCFNELKSISTSVHEKALNLYKTYLATGGMPESVANMVNVNKDYIKYNKDILKDILTSYFNDMNKYVSTDSEALKIERIYNSLPTQLANLSNKFQYSNVQENARKREYATSLDWLLASNMAILCKCVKVPTIPLEGFTIEDTFKLYLSDVGILNCLLKLSVDDIINDKVGLYKGVIAENYVANQLICKGYDLYYWKNNNQSEIDFLLYTKDGIVPVEVKAGDTTQSKSLRKYIEEYNPVYSIRISAKDFGYDKENRIKFIPLYATFML